jgi:deoxyhypusine synthase
MNTPNTKAELLANTVEHVDIQAYDARAVIDAMRKMSFTSRDTARAADILSMAIEDPACSVWITLAGSTSAGGCMHVYRDMLKYGMADVVVSTGASIVDMDFFEALGFRHYQAQAAVDDRDLRALYIDRIYDTYIDEEELQACDAAIKEIADSLEPRPYSSREFIHEMGRWLADGHARKPGSLVQTAFEEGAPIFCPAFTDSSAGFGLVKHQVERMKAGRPYLTIDSVADRREGRRRHDGPVHDRRRRAEELRPGHGGLRGDPRHRGRDAQVRGADHGGRRARRRVLVLDPQGGLLLGQGGRDL